MQKTEMSSKYNYRKFLI